MDKLPISLPEKENRLGKQLRSSSSERNGKKTCQQSRSLIYQLVFLLCSSFDEVQHQVLLAANEIMLSRGTVPSCLLASNYCVTLI